MSQDQEQPLDELIKLVGSSTIDFTSFLSPYTERINLISQRLVEALTPSISDNEIENLQRLLATHRDVLTILLQQQAHTGPLTAPATVLHIRDCRAEIARIKAELRAGGVAVTDIVTDEERSNVAEVKSVETLTATDMVPEKVNVAGATLLRSHLRIKNNLRALLYEQARLGADVAKDIDYLRIRIRVIEQGLSELCIPFDPYKEPT